MRTLFFALGLSVAVRAGAVTVSLAATGGNTVGSTLTLSATVTPSPPPSSLRPGRPSIGTLKQTKPTYSYAYTYSVNRVSPCQEAINISGSGATTNWVPPANKAGKYNAKVIVVEKIRNTDGTVSENSATASIPLTISRVGEPVKVTLTGGGQTVNVAAKATPPSGGPYTYHFRVFARAGGTVGNYASAYVVGSYDGDQSSMNATFNWTITPSVHVEVDVDAVSKTDCTLISSVGTADRNLQ